jgi:hypothetical protein
VQNGRLLLIFEGGAQRYSRNHPVNRIDNVHMGNLGALLALTDPPAPPAAPNPAQAPTGAAAPVSGTAPGAAAGPVTERSDPAQAPVSRPTAPQPLNT